MSDLAVVDALRHSTFRGSLRQHQELALDSAAHYLVLPPGAGKTVVGLEAARRLGRRVLVLTPNTAVQAQWADTWRRHFDSTVDCGTDRSLTEPLTVLTYQSLAVLERDDDEPGRRRAAIHGSDRAALLELLHPNGRDLIARAARLAPWTLVLDECHHLLQTWGALVRALVDELGESTTVLGLTATPPRQLTAWQRDLHDDLFSAADFEVPAAALVKDGELAPYQELVYLTAPTVEESSWLADQQSRFARLQLELTDERLGTIPLLDWLQRRIVARQAESGATLAWPEFEAAEPELARAGLRFAAAGLIPVPADLRLREEHRAAVGAADWVAVLTDFCLGHLEPSDAPADAEALAAIRRVLPSLGYRLTRSGVRQATSPVDRMCGLSAAKTAAAVHVLATEDEALHEQLRALVLCDFESAAGELPGTLRGTPLTTSSGSAHLALRTIADADVRGRGALRPMLVTGRTVAAPRLLAPEFLDHCARAGHRVTAEPLDGAPDIVRFTGDTGWSAQVWSGLATDFFAAGAARVLIGTRALLGEGWDCAAVNVTVDLTTAATPTAVTQMRGRSMRLDPARAEKVADNWTISCVTAEHPRGDADYLRLVRKHDAYLAPAAGGLIESGVSHCDPALSPYAPPDADELAAVTARALGRVGDRAKARTDWAIGQPYEGGVVSTVRVRAERSLGVDGRVVPAIRAVPATGRPRGPRRWAGLTGVGAIAGATVADLAAGLPAGIGAGVGLVALGVGIPALWQANQLTSHSTALDQLAAAVADGLHDAGGTAVGASGVRIAPIPDGWLRCQLDGVSEAESALFTTSLDELLAPLGEPRHLVGRVVLTVPTRRRSRMALAVRATLGLPLEAAVTWHAVPSWSAAGSRRLRIFLDAWERHVGSRRCLVAASPEGQAVLELFRGADPFALTTQLRTVWR